MRLEFDSLYGFSNSRERFVVSRFLGSHPHVHMFDTEYELDPAYSNSLKETKVILIVFVLWAVYTLSTAYAFGYSSQAASEEGAELAEISTILGMPSWVFWSIVVPWLAANLITGWFCFSYFSDDNLAESGEQDAMASGSETENSHE